MVCYGIRAPRHTGRVAAAAEILIRRRCRLSSRRAERHRRREFVTDALGQIRSKVFAQSCQQRDRQTNNDDYII